MNDHIERPIDLGRLVAEADEANVPAQPQDGGTAVMESRAAVAQRFGVTEADVRTIEREGLDGGWPPL